MSKRMKVEYFQSSKDGIVTKIGDDCDGFFNRRNESPTKMNQSTNTSSSKVSVTPTMSPKKTDNLSYVIRIPSMIQNQMIHRVSIPKCVYPLIVLNK